MKNIIRIAMRRVVAVALAGLLAAGSVPAFAASSSSSSSSSSSGPVEVGRVSGTWTLDMWHYSGGYWKVGNKGSEQIRIEDSSIRSIDQYLQANQRAVFTASVSEEIAQLLREGERGTDWQVRFADYRGRNCAMLFAESAPDSIVLTDDGTVEFSATPVFHFTDSGASLRDFVPGMAVTVPLIDRRYGYNIYSVFGNGRSAVQALGYYNEANPSDLGTNAIHPSMIRDRQGKLAGGHSITLGSQVVDSTGYSIGSGTFSAAGACGLHFEFPVSLVFTDLREDDIDPPGEDPPQPPPGDDPEDPEDPEDPPGDPQDPADDPDDDDISAVDAILELPRQAYVGHEVTARDASLYEVAGVTYGAVRAAQLGIGKSRFSMIPSSAGSLRKSGQTNAIAVFSKPGTFQVKLTATASNGLTDSDTQSIEILKTPAVMADIGGVQKENRKQTLLVTVAQDPRHPVRELTIRLIEPQSGESIFVSKVFGGEEAAPQNSAHIKYRSLSNVATDSCYLCVQLDFLTKWHETRTLHYEVFAKDDAGETDLAQGSFPVAPDEPPAAAIELEERYYREEGGGAAKIDVRCASTSDGDALQRNWEVSADGSSWQAMPSLPSYEDRSFGSGQSVLFEKAGVGAFRVRLSVRDIWTEETLAEYVTEADRLSSSAEKLSVVDNIAPRVSLELVRPQSAEILLLTGTEEVREAVLAAAPSLKAALLQEGVTAQMSAELLQARLDDQTGAMKELTTGGVGAKNYRESSQQLQYTYARGMWTGGNVASDERFCYQLMPSCQVYAADPAYSIHTYPFTLSAMDRDGNIVWSRSITRSILDSQTLLRDASWGFDANGTYLYLIDGQKTALFDRDTGTYIATLDCALGEYQLVRDDGIYAFKDSGIWRIPRAGGSLRCVWSGELSCPAYCEGVVTFLAKMDLGTGLGLYRCRFEPEGEKVRCTLLEGSQDGWARGAEGLAIDTAGRALVRAGRALYFFGSDGLLLRTVTLPDNPKLVFPIQDGSGRVVAAGSTGYRKVGGKYETWCECYALASQQQWRDAVYDGYDYCNYGMPVVYAAQDENGAIGVYLGCEYVYSTGERATSALRFSFNGTFRHPMGFSMEQGRQGLRYIGATANLHDVADIKQIVHIAESPQDELQRLKGKNLSGAKNYSYVADLRGLSESAVGEAMEEVLAAIRAQKAQGGLAAQFEGEGSLTRSLSLVPGATYYYEYETTATEDILSVSAQLQMPEGMQARAGGYQVQAVYSENFDDADMEAFFAAGSARPDGGRFRIAYLRTNSYSSTRLQTGTSEQISFTVPAGFRAVLQTDYTFSCQSAGPLAAQLLLTREGAQPVSLDIPYQGQTSGAGTYMHAQLLESGRYTLHGMVRDFAKNGGRESCLWIDNLCVMLVQEGDAQQTAGLQRLNASSSVSGEGTVRRVRGSFTMPQRVMHFGLYPADRVSGLSNAFASVRETLTYKGKTQTLSLYVPEGRQALYAVLTGSGRGRKRDDRERSSSYCDALWTQGDLLLGTQTVRPSGSYDLFRLDEQCRFVWKVPPADLAVSAFADTGHGARVEMEGLTLYVSKAGACLPQALLSGRFFEEGQALYAEDLIFSGSAQISLALPDGAMIRNLRVIREGEKAEETAIACAFSAEDDLNGWTAAGTSAKILPFAAEKEEPARVYARGETIEYQAFYGDWESDPSKKQHWVYAHEPLSDGPFPQAGQDLASPVERFWIDGKYTVTHWQEDDTGVAAFDKESNRIELTFYVTGGSANGAPWVTNIRTEPSVIKEGTSFTVQGLVDDREKDALTVTVELYKDGAGKPLGARTVRDLRPDAAGRYPAVTLSGLPKAQPGVYDVVVAVSDGQGADVDTLRFRVLEERSLTGSVTHTAAWEANRQAWNEAKKGTDAVRPANMFWPGEELVLHALVGGEPVAVDAQLLEFPQYAARLSKGGAGADGKTAFSGQLWHASMLQTIGTTKPVPATVRFTARYADGETLVWDVAIIFDQSKGSYYQLHRNY